MKKLTMIWVFGILALCLVTVSALAERPSRMPTTHAGSRGMSRESGTPSRAHLSSPNSRISHPAPVMQNSRNSMNVPKMTSESRKSPDTRINYPAKTEKSFQSSHREDKKPVQNDRNRPESRERSFDRDFRREDREDRDHDRRPPQREFSRREHYYPRLHRPEYSHRDYWRRDHGFSVSIGTNWDWSSYDSFYSNYYNNCDSGLYWGISYGSDDYEINFTSGNPTYVSSYQVWIPGCWETVNDRVTDIGPYGIVCWRYSSREVWKPGYWKVCYR